MLRNDDDPLSGLPLKDGSDSALLRVQGGNDLVDLWD